MQGSFEYKIDARGDKVALAIDLDSVSAKALVRVDRYINWTDILKLAENDPEAAHDRVPGRGVRVNQEVMDSGMVGMPVRRSRRTG